LPCDTGSSSCRPSLDATSNPATIRSKAPIMPCSSSAVMNRMVGELLVDENEVIAGAKSLGSCALVSGGVGTGATKDLSCCRKPKETQKMPKTKTTLIAMVIAIIFQAAIGTESGANSELGEVVAASLTAHSCGA